jgi:hypothetical protein
LLYRFHMKKMLFIGVTFGIATFAQATDITLVSGGSINGANAYQYLINSISLSANESIVSASLVFNNITLTSTDAKDTITADLINKKNATYTYGDNDTAGDYFTTKYGSSAINLGTQTFAVPVYHAAYYTGTWPNRVYHPAYYTYDTESWSFNLNDAALGYLNADVLAGGFDIGIDPDCIYTVGSIVFTYDTVTHHDYRVPDQGMTAGLLGMGLLGLVAFRRKLALN